MTRPKVLPRTLVPRRAVSLPRGIVIILPIETNTAGKRPLNRFPAVFVGSFGARRGPACRAGPAPFYRMVKVRVLVYTPPAGRWMMFGWVARSSVTPLREGRLAHGSMQT